MIGFYVLDPLIVHVQNHPETRSWNERQCKTPNTIRQFSGEFHVSAGKIPAAKVKISDF